MFRPACAQKVKLVDCVPRKHALRIWIALMALLCSMGIGATTVTVVNTTPPICAQFLQMVKAAGMAHMTDSQLCDFRFGRLPSGMTGGFVFPQWKEMPVGDPAAMYQRMVAANRAPHSAASPPSDLATRVDAVVQAARDHNLKFYKTQLLFDGKPVTFVLMDIVRCATSSYMKRFPPILYRAAFEDDDLNQAIPSDIGGYGEIAIWHGSFPVLLTSFHKWMTGLGYPENVVDLGNLRRKPQGSWPSGASFTGGNLCSFTINKKGVITNGR